MRKFKAFAIVAMLSMLVGTCFAEPHTKKMGTTQAVQSGLWHDQTTWSDGIPDSNTRAVVPNGVTVFLAGTDHFAKELVIQGNLTVLESAGVDKTLSAKWIHVNSGGVFQVGTILNRYDENQFTVTLTGDDPTEVFNIEGVPNPITDNTGFLMVAGGGQLQFFGQEKTSFTRLAQTSNVGSNLIIVEKQIDRNFDGVINGADGVIDWRVGDQIVIASSSLDYADEEVRTITSIADVGDGTQVITLNAPLVNRHFGEIETYQNTTRTYSVDMRAEVAVLNRTIKIQGEPHHDTDNNFGDRSRFDAGIGDGFGGHTMIMASAGQITIDNVQFDLMGQTSRLGRYPVHWHIGGDRTGDLLRGASITNSNNRGVTIHATHNVVVQDVVLHDVHGHGFFMENGVETGNVFLNNIAFGIHKVGRSDAVGDLLADLNDPFIVDTHDHVGQNPERFLSSAAFWITNPDNHWVGNISAGSDGTGFWFILPDFAIGDSFDDPQYANVRANRTDLREFDHNSSHSSRIGLNFDRGPDIEVPVGAVLDAPSFGRRYFPPNEPQFNNYTAYQHHVGIYHRGDIGNFHENRFADNFTSTFITFTQRITDTLYVGHSRGNSDINMIVTGHSLYDGANTLDGNHFAGFQASNAHTFRTHGEETRHTAYACSNTSFENDGTSANLSISTRTGGAIHANAFSPSALYDVDGTLTGPSGGGPGMTIVTNRPFLYDANDVQPPGWNAWLSDDLYSLFHVRGVADNTSFRFTAPDGDMATIEDNSFNTILKNDVGDYVVDFPDGPSSVEDGFEVLHYTRVGPSGATVVRFIGIGPILEPTLEELNDLNSLRNSTSSAFFRSDDDIYVKFFSSNERVLFETINEGFIEVVLYCDDDPADPAVSNENGGLMVNPIPDPTGDPNRVIVGEADFGNATQQFISISPISQIPVTPDMIGMPYSFEVDYYIPSNTTMSTNGASGGGPDNLYISAVFTFAGNSTANENNGFITVNNAVFDTWRTFRVSSVIPTGAVLVRPVVVMVEAGFGNPIPSPDPGVAFYLDNVKMIIELPDPGCDFDLGDVNHDGDVNLLDVAGFVDAVGTSQFVCEADINEDGNVNLLDVEPFIDLLSN